MLGLVVTGATLGFWLIEENVKTLVDSFFFVI